MRANGVNLPANVRWQSGATAEVQLHIDLAKGNSWNYIFQRPNAPGREADEQFGLQTESARQQKEAQEQQQLQNILLQQNEAFGRIGTEVGGIIGGKIK